MELTALNNEADILAHLRSVEVVGPSLHPNVNSENYRNRWNGWNHAVAVGITNTGKTVEAMLSVYASGGEHVSIAVNGGGRVMSTDPRWWALGPEDYPLHMLPAVADILHPEHTPTTTKETRDDK